MPDLVSDVDAASSLASRPVVFVLDDNDDILTTLSFILERQGFTARAFRSSESFFAAATTAPACALIDWNLGAQDGLIIAARCRRELPQTALILISGAVTIATTVQAMRLGVATVLPKPIDPVELAQEVRAAVRQMQTRGTLAGERHAARRRIDNLAPSEREILELVARGTPNKCIASHMSLAIRTVEKRRRKLFDALEVDSAAEATRIFVLATLDQ